MGRLKISIFVPFAIEYFLIPKDNENPIKIEIRHEIVDIEGARSWVAREKLEVE